MVSGDTCKRLLWLYVTQRALDRRLCVNDTCDVLQTLLPAFGRAMRTEWPLDPTLCYLNHGTVGAVPKRVIAAQRAWQDTMERNPAEFMLRRLVPLVGTSPECLTRTAAKRVAAFLGAPAASFGFTRNVTSAINAVLRSLCFEPGDEVVVSSETYGAVTIGAQAITKSMGASVVVADIDNPYEASSWKHAVERTLSPRTRLVILEHVASGCAAVVDLAPLIALCHARGIRVLVDGAHAPGAIPVDIESLGCDYYAGNLHKWMWTPRSCGVLAVHPQHAGEVHAPILSWGYGNGLSHELDWEGTTDPTPALATEEALAMFTELSFEAVHAYNHGLAWRAYQRLAELAPQPYRASEDAIGTMASVFLAERFGSTTEDAKRVRDWLWHEHQIEMHVYAARNRLVGRISAQVYVDDEDIERLVKVLTAPPTVV